MSSGLTWRHCGLGFGEEGTFSAIDCKFSPIDRAPEIDALALSRVQGPGGILSAKVTLRSTAAVRSAVGARWTAEVGGGKVCCCNSG